LQFGIDSEAMVAAALRECKTSDEQPDRTRDGPFATTVLDQLVARFLEPRGDDRDGEAGCNPGTGGAEFGMDQGAVATGSGLAAQAARHPLAVWLERLHAVMSAVQPRAVEIVALRVEGFRDRDIAERLGLGRRLVRRIVEDAGTNWEHEMRNGAIAKE
jgi:hypothetical protein